MVKCEDNYSFRLSLDGSNYSDSGTMNSAYKRRIDSLFRDKRSPQHTSRCFVTNADVHNSESSSSFSESPVGSPTIASPSPILKTSIKVPSLQSWGKTPTPKEELERLFGGRDQQQQAFHDVRSAVQAQIERLFADAAGEPNAAAAALGSKSHMPKMQTPVIATSIPVPPPPPPKNSQLHRPLPPSPSPSVGASDSNSSVERGSPIPCHVLASMNYRVDYLGSLQLSEKASSLEVLQEPLKELYYKYRLGIFKGRKPLPGSLHITDSGIRITHGSKENPGFYQLLNPFPTIAVWAAVKLVIRREVGEHGQMFFSYAFLPLICDPESQDKYNLYHELNVGNPNIMAGDHPPMFACVMRKVGVPKVLECHGFVCQSAEDAIVIAANLYQALLETMRAGDHTSDSNESREYDERHIMSDSEVVPIRPPRRKRSRYVDSSFSRAGSRRLKRSSSEDFLRSEDFVRTESRVSKRRIKRSVSDRHSLASLDDSDTYSKSLMPRSKSFINVSSKYGFQDLLYDVKQKTGLKSVDDVLKQIINPRGMSFTEMDPKYRELLLKLALTLSKDEIYQRSKNIMRKHKYRTTSIASLIDSDSESSTISSVIRATKRSFSRLGSRASSLNPPSIKESLSKKSSHLINPHSPQNHLFKEKSKTLERSGEIAQVVNTLPSKRPVPKTPMPRRNEERLNEGYASCNECGYDSECSSKCYCSLPRRKHLTPSQNENHNSSTLNKNNKLVNKGYLNSNNNNNNRVLNNNHNEIMPTKSETDNKNIDSACECDTESCAESEKCYCSLKRVKNGGVKMYEINLDSETDTNTDTTIKSSLTYGRNYETHSSSSNRHRTSSPYLTEHSKSRSAGTVFSVHHEQIRKKSRSTNFSSDSDTSDAQRSSGCSSIASGYHSQGSTHRGPYPRSRSASNEHLSDSMRYKRHHHSTGVVGSIGSRDSNRSSHRSSLGSLMDKGSQRSRSSSGSQQKILLVSAVDPSGKVVYRGASQKQRSEVSDTNSIMSMKKTAEIAALFSELKLNQTTDLINDTNNTTSESEDDAYSSMQANNSFLFSENIENSLGYLP